MRGRDIKKYSYEFAELYLICTFPSLKIDIEKYPAVKAHLLAFGFDRLDQSGKPNARKKTHNKWFETQDSISYWEDFQKEKIVYPNMTLFLPFVFDNEKFYTNQKCFIITSTNINLKFLVGFLNSKISHLWIRANCPELQGGTRELSKIFFEKIPIPQIPENEQELFINLVDEIMKKKENTQNIENQIDKLVYALYELTEDEIKIIENTTKTIK